MLIEVVMGGTILTDVTVICNNWKSAVTTSLPALRQLTTSVIAVSHTVHRRTIATSPLSPAFHDVYTFHANISAPDNLGVSATFDCSIIGEFYTDYHAAERLVCMFRILWFFTHNSPLFKVANRREGGCKTQDTAHLITELQHCSLNTMKCFDRATLTNIQSVKSVSSRFVARRDSKS